MYIFVTHSLYLVLVLTQSYHFALFSSYCIILVVALKWSYFQSLTPISQRNMSHGVLWASWPCHVRTIHL